MKATFWKTIFATGLYALLHSLLASRQVKAAAAQRLGLRNRNGLYRAFFNAQSLFTFAALLAFLRRLPDRPLYQVRGLPAALLRLGQLAGLGLAAAGAYKVGLLRISGLKNLSQWLAGAYAIEAEPEAQGPAPSVQDGRLDTSGPFAWSRHPLNFSPIPIFWLTPAMDQRRLAFNLLATLYLVLGSFHEESRLKAAYGLEYEVYRHSGVSFLLPLK